MDPDQDLLDRLDRREGPGAYANIMLAGVLAALAGLVTYFTLEMELRLSGEIAIDAAILVFIGSALLLAISHFRLR
jgi:hypothetical protein